MPVLSQDSRRLGTVDRLILDDRRRRLEALVVHKLLQAGDRIVPMGLVERVGEDSIVLRIAADDADQLPTFVRQVYVEVAPAAALHALYASIAPGAASFLALAPVAGRHPIEEVATSSPPAPIPPGARVKVESNVSTENDVIGSGTDVLAADGRKIGSVAEVLVDPDGCVTAVVVKAGILFAHDVLIPDDWIAEIGDRHIRLKVTAEQAEAARHPGTAAAGWEPAPG
jgi:uncharacterized protein YrrD